MRLGKRRKAMLVYFVFCIIGNCFSQSGRIETGIFVLFSHCGGSLYLSYYSGGSRKTPSKGGIFYLHRRSGTYCADRPIAIGQKQGTGRLASLAYRLATSDGGCLMYGARYTKPGEADADGYILKVAGDGTTISDEPPGDDASGGSRCFPTRFPASLSIRSERQPFRFEAVRCIGQAGKIHRIKFPCPGSGAE